jgi:hypothetical protein
MAASSGPSVPTCRPGFPYETAPVHHARRRRGGVAAWGMKTAERRVQATNVAERKLRRPKPLAISDP